MFSYLLANKLKFKLDNSSNNSINLIKNGEENVSLNNNKIKYAPHLSNKMNQIIIDKKLNNNDILENIKKNLQNNNININNHKDIKLSDVHKTKIKSSERIKRNLNLHLNNINNINSRKNTGHMTNNLNTYVPGKLTLSLSSENKMNRKNRINKNYKYNYDYNFNFNSSPNKERLINSPVDTLNISNEIIHSKNRNGNISEAKTLALPFNDEYSKKNIINYSPKKDGFGFGQSSENKTLGYIQQTNNKGEILTTKNKDNLKFNFMKDIKFNNIININMPKENSDNKLYMLTESNNPSNNIVKTKSKTNSKNYLINSERSNKRNGNSLQKGINKEKKYNLTKVIQDSQSEKKGIKKNKSFGHNSIDEEAANKQNRNIRKLRLRKGSNEKIKNREDLLRYALFNNNKNHKYSNFNNLITLNNNLLPKLNDHMYIKSEKSN